MRTLNRKEIEALAHGESIPRFVARIKKVWDQNSDVGEYGQWWLQNLGVVVEGDDKEIQVTWTGEDAFVRASEGQTYSFECTENKKGRLVGVSRDIRHAKDGSNRIFKGIKVTPQSKIKQMTGGGDGEARAADIRDKGQHGGAGDDAGDAWPEEKPKGVDTSVKSTYELVTDALIEQHAEQARKVFVMAAEKAADAFVIMVSQEAADNMTSYERADLVLRIAQNFAIDVQKTIRKERF